MDKALLSYGDHTKFNSKLQDLQGFSRIFVFIFFKNSRTFKDIKYRVIKNKNIAMLAK